ncbi:ABC transporter permease [Gracilibacillus kekensis]|uniref:ABC-2 type transport system permease protein n=1 Tax=Gracilibacillus kekensis TaxID=1027249 RepID=A0A1M7L1H3_9BACI|nr:ABC transporter permease [Gracilibacillus kekensis]SHM71577.1 ABC-2 type transport system permease protein [Gracilibacillus kekensis]
MFHIFTLQWQRFRRKPLMVLAMIAMTIVFILFIGGANSEPQTMIPVSFSDDIVDSERSGWIDQLNELDGFKFADTEYEQSKERVALGNSSFGVIISEQHYTFLVGTETPNQSIVEQFISSLYWEKEKIDLAVSASGDDEASTKIEKSLKNPPIKVESVIGESEKDFFIFDNQLQALFGMTLFFAIYTIVFSLSEVAEEKQRGSWDRLILSPVRKWQVYLGHLSSAFVIGMAQMIVIFLMFQVLFGFDIGDKWLEILLICAFYTFAIVSLGMLIIGLVNKASQLSAIVPIVAVSMAMLGGAYWPIEIVSNNMVIIAAKAVPITYAMDALKSVTIYGNDLATITQPLVVLFFMGVLCMGIGINLMERR